ncbi:Venom nerve growth factor, partial [Bienertia sinuspersici]
RKTSKNPNLKEHDQLIRSNKKAKRYITYLIFNNTHEQNDVLMEENVNENYNTESNRGIVGTNISFKNMLQGSHSGANAMHTEGISNPLFNHAEDHDEESDEDLPPEDMDNDPKCPIILLTKEEKKRIRQPWKSSLIIKMFDKNIGYMTLMRRLTKKWQLKGELSLTDVGKVIKIGKTTATAERGQFTKLCVGLNLSKPLLSKFWLKGKIWKIHKINHKEEDFPKLVKQKHENSEHEVENRLECLKDFGSWMLVKKPTQTRTPIRKKSQLKQWANPWVNQIQKRKDHENQGDNQAQIPKNIPTPMEKKQETVQNMEIQAENLDSELTQ